MPALPDTPFCVEVRFSGTYSSAKWVNVMHVGHSSPGLTTTDLDTFAGAMRNQWNTNLAPLLNSSGVLTQTQCTDLSSHSGAVGVNTTASTGLRVSGTALPANIALVISWKISRRYRGGHPRTYLVGMSSSDVNQNTLWTGTFQTAALAGARAFRTGVNALTLAGVAGVYLANLSYYHAGALRPTGALDAISDAVIHTRVDTQRRRLGKEVI